MRQLGGMVEELILAAVLAALITLPFEMACRAGTQAGIEASRESHRACLEAYQAQGQPTIYEKCGVPP